MKNKIITAFLSVFFLVVILNINNVFGIGAIGQAWMVDSDWQLCMLFRVYTTPDSSLVTSYHNKIKNKSVDYVEDGSWQYKYNGKKYTSKWLDMSSSGYDVPGKTTFKTIGFVFHTKQMGNYESKSSPYIGYNYSNFPVGSSISSIKHAYKNSEKKYTTPKDVEDYDDVKFFELMRSTGKYKIVNWGTKLTISNIKHANYVDYRMAIVEIDGHNIVINDYIIYPDNVQALMKAAKDAEMLDECYISNIITSKAYSTGKYEGQIEVARTVKKFFSQYNMGYDAWSKSTQGRISNDKTKALGAVANLYDNKLKFPQLARRSVMVRHINIGTNTVISTDIIDNAIENGGIMKPDNTKITATNPVEQLPLEDCGEWYDGSVNSQYKDAEHYPNILYMEQGLLKNAESNTTTYKCIGSNVSVASSWAAAMRNIDIKIANSEFDKATSIEVPGESTLAESDYIVIDFYYSEYDKEVEVNHVYVDNNGYVVDAKKQTIVPNKYAKEGNVEIYRTNTNKYISEIYSKRKGKDITVRVADSLNLANNEKITYLGHEKLTTRTSINSIVGNQIKQEKLSNSQTAKISGNTVQVNFYYKIDNTIELKEPEKVIDGKVFAIAQNENKRGVCTDDELLHVENVASAPSGENAIVGVKGIPKYMLAAITKQHISNEEYTAPKYQVKFKMGSQTKTATFDNIKFKTSYYKITNMAVYKLNNVTIYDAGKEGTIGSSLFDWNQKTVQPKDMNLTIKLYGVKGQMTNGVNAINNANNYVNAVFKDESGKSAPTSQTYLTTAELIQVDANVDGAVTDADKTMSKSVLDKLYSDLIDKQKIEQEKADAYADVYNEQERLKSVYEEKKNEKERLEGIMNQYYYDLQSKNQAIIRINNDIAEYTNELETLEEELATLKSDEEKKLKEKTDAVKAYDAASKKMSELTVELSNVDVKIFKLQAAINGCDDIVGEETVVNEQLNEIKTCEDIIDKYTKIEIEQGNENVEVVIDDSTEYEIGNTETTDDKLTEEEIKELKEQAEACWESGIIDDKFNYESKKAQIETCKQNTKKYNEANTERKALEDEINKFTLEEWKPASDNKTKAESEYKEIEDAIKAKEKEINDKEQQISTTTITLGMAKNEYDKFDENVYKPAKEEFESYRDNEYTNAKKEYDDYVDADYVEIADNEWDEAINARDEAYSAWDIQDKYNTNLLEKFDEYKAKYDAFMAIDENNLEAVANMLNLKLDVKVQNMRVEITAGKGKAEIKSAKESEQATFNVEDMLKNPNEYGVHVESEPIINKSLYTAIASEDKIDEQRLLLPTDYDNANKILTKTTNGVRALAGKVEYEAINQIGGDAVNKIRDNVYYADQSNNNSETVFRIETTKLEKKYAVKTSTADDNIKYEQTEPINVYTPITVSANLKSDLTGTQIVSRTDNIAAIQLNTPFTLELKNDVRPGTYSIANTSQYSGGFYVKFGFDVHNVKINGKVYNSGQRIEADTWIGLIPKNTGTKTTTITAQAYGNLESLEQGMVTEDNGYYIVRAVAYNATDILKKKSLKYKNLDEIANSDLKSTVHNLCTNPSYFAQTEQVPVIIVNRVFDFKVTDIADINWKNVFRYNTGGSINAHKSIVYYTGNKKWDTASSKSNNMVNRPASEIGKVPLRTLPVGPYKNTDPTYVKAPKLGYRFSFDMKVTGSYYTTNAQNQVVPNEEKYVTIKTKFYYISKDGKTYLPEYTGTSKPGIYLFYKTSDGKYVRIDENGGGYKLRFTPNDGYRYIKDTNVSTLANKSVELGQLREIKLKHNMATVSNNGAIITYYGEYKLPNSTIAVEVDKNGNYDINKPLKDGYIGVVFDIYARAGKIDVASSDVDVELSYSKDTDGKNTSQWDYEGFLGIKAGQSVSSTPLTLKLEKGTRKITNLNEYKEIRGTVMLYDIDQRAATDYE